ncbi:MAG: C2 family cysteine protease [Leptolyngbyaceae cyanobacterium bins.349]|nr:C2 family cysteine protease [Leptolyngbyaceae cyanobacterium bins.349]
MFSNQSQLFDGFAPTSAAPVQANAALLPTATATAYGLGDPLAHSQMLGSSAPLSSDLSNSFDVTNNIIIDRSFTPLPIFITDNSLGTANSLGNLTGTVSRTGFVGSSDLNDYYKVNLTGAGSTNSLNITLTGLSADADLELIRDFNNDGLIGTGERISFSNRSGFNDESINLHNLAGGEYFIGVNRWFGDTNYTLRLSNQFVSNLLAVESNVGTLVGTQYFTNPSPTEGENSDRRSGLAPSDSSDFYRFSIGSIRNVSLALTGIGNSSDFDLRLIRDYNSNGIVDAGEELATSTHSSNWNEAINKNLEAGDYFVQVNRWSGDSNYSLKLTEAAAQVRFTVNQLVAIDNPDSGVFGDDADYYSRISINGTPWTSGAISNDNNISPNWQFTQNVNSRYVNIEVQVWDSDGGFAGGNDHIDIDARGGFRNLDLTYDVITNQITGDVTGLGGRMLSVSGGGDGDRARMNFTIDSGDWYNMNLRDADMIDLTRSFAADGTLDRNDMIAILRDTKDSSVVDATELTDLRRIVNDLGYLMPAHVKNLSGKVVGSDPANGRSGIGDLFVGSSATQMERLIGKWFLGNDRPVAATGTVYREVSGQLYQGGISVNDIDQGSLGDCYFLASLGAFAHDRPSVIQNMFIDNGDNTFTVRFFKPDGSADYVTVDRFLPVNTLTNRLEYAGRDREGLWNSATNELWVALAEKAYAQVNQSGYIGQDNTNTYAGIDSGWMAPVMQQITGASSGDRNVTAMTATELINLVNSATTPITAGFVSGGGFGVVNSHAYTITSYNATTGQFRLHNPWGNTHADVTYSQLRSLNARIQWSNV